MEITDEQYAQAIKTVHDYRQERGMIFYLPININQDETLTLEQFKLYLSIQKSIQ